jgi:hypothetical protein
VLRRGVAKIRLRQSPKRKEYLLERRSTLIPKTALQIRAVLASHRQLLRKTHDLIEPFFTISRRDPSKTHNEKQSPK